MKKIQTKPHFFLWLSTPVILLIGLNGYNDKIDINIYHTYFVTTGWHLALLISTVFAVLGLIYWGLIISGFKPIAWLTITHLGCTIDTLLFVWLILLFDWFSQTDVLHVAGLSDQSLVLVFLLILFLFGQILFVLNLILTIVLNKKA